MAEFLTMSEAEDKFGSKGKTNAALTLGIIGTGLAALSNNGGCGCGNNGGVLQPGSIVATSSANNIIVSGNSLVVTNKGTYMIDVSVIGTPGTVSSTIIPTISVNGVIVSAAPVASGATAVNTEYEIKTVLSLNKGDVITITNTGASALNINSVDAPAYNVNILIERFN